jgi:hypothetical protein
MMPPPDRQPLPLDSMLVAHVQACATGANIHRATAILACYRGYAELGDPERFSRVETLLRAFTRTGVLPPT